MTQNARELIFPKISRKKDIWQLFDCQWLLTDKKIKLALLKISVIIEV